MKIRAVGAELFHEDGWADRNVKVTFAFRNSGKASKNSSNFPQSFLIINVIESEAKLHHLQCHSRDLNGFQLLMPHMCNKRLTY